MGFDGHRITYVASADDRGAAIVRMRQPSRWSPLLWLLSLGMGLAGVYGIVIGAWSMAAGMVVGAAVAFVGAGYHSVRFTSWLAGRQSSDVGQEVTLSLGDAGLEFEVGARAGTLAWPDVDEVIDDRSVVVVTRDRTRSWAIIPKSAFAGPDQVEAFCGAIRKRRDQARKAVG